MSISSINAQSTQLRAIAALRNSAVTNSSRAATAAPRQADAVVLSDTAKALSSATNTVNAASDVREDRVAAIKAALANGTYKVDSRQLAQAMVRASQ
jgi:negative regulator of flagellin synthesis FlgM